jgi:hypothetical protein
MRIIKSTLFSLVLLAGGVGAAQAQAPAIPGPAKPTPMVRDAREQIPAVMLGVWKADASPARPGIQLRTFQLTEEGKLMVSFLNIGADGKQSFGHWWLQVDGVSTGYEYYNDNYSTPIAVIRLKKVDDYTFDLTNTVAGKESSKTLYKFSPDGSTFTLVRAPGTPKEAASVYHKWDGR